MEAKKWIFRVLSGTVFIAAAYLGLRGLQKNLQDYLKESQRSALVIPTRIPLSPTSALEASIVNCVNFSDDHKFITIIVGGKAVQVPEGQTVEICGQPIPIQAIGTPTPSR